MFMYIIAILVVIVIVVFLLGSFNSTNDARAYNLFVSDLQDFEAHYLDTLQVKFAQKAEKIANPTRVFTDDGNIFQGLRPWTAPVDFGTTMHTLIGYGVRLRTPGDSLYMNQALADNLFNAVMLIYYNLPYPAPVHSAPWGPRTDWYHFSITMPECIQNTCIVLRGFYNLSPIVEHILYYYLPEPTVSMGWRRTAGNAMRMGLPYAYGQLLRGYSYDYIRNEPEMVYVFDLIRFPLVQTGNGIHLDYAYFDHTDVRAYGYLINSFFTFSYYNFLFGDEVVHMDNLNTCINLVGSRTGYVNPAVLSRQGSNHSNVIGSLLDYRDEVVSADFSKILTVRNSKYFGSVVGQTAGVAYYEADENNNRHAPLWAMTRKIWANSGRVITLRRDMLGLESGIMLTNNLSGIVSVPTTGPSTSSFHPVFAHTGIANTKNAGAMVMHAQFKELNIEFHSYTLYHRLGMFQLYHKIKTLTPLGHNARCIVLTRNLAQEERWAAAANAVTSNQVTARHHNIDNNPTFSNFALRTFEDVNMQTMEQLIGADSINRGEGQTCFSLLVQSEFDRDNTAIVRIPNTDAFVVTTNTGSVQCVIDFPIVVVKDREARQVTINDATSTTRSTHHLAFDRITAPLSYISLSVHDLRSSSINKSQYDFYFSDTQSNQFKFSLK
jgi:hypothetical protein